jgi:hypothetical protein
MRSVRILNVISEDEAKAAQLPTDRLQRKKYLRIDDDKGNNRAPAERASWVRFVSVTLPNDIGILKPGDSVGVLEPWVYPDPDENTQLSAAADDVYLCLLRQFDDTGRFVNDKKGSNYAPKQFAKEETAKRSHLTDVAFEHAQRRLFSAKKIRITTFKRGGRDTDRIEEV